MSDDLRERAEALAKDLPLGRWCLEADVRTIHKHIRAAVEAERAQWMSGINDLDAVVHALGIEDSHTNPAEAVALLYARIVALETALSGLLNTTCEERQNPAVWFARVDAARAALS